MTATATASDCDETREAKLALMRAEAAREKARIALISADVDVRAAQEVLIAIGRESTKPA